MIYYIVSGISLGLIWCFGVLLGRAFKPLEDYGERWYKKAYYSLWDSYDKTYDNYMELNKRYKELSELYKSQNKRLDKVLGISSDLIAENDKLIDKLLK